MPSNLTIVGRMLIDKYSKLDMQHKFTVINNEISINQLVQLFNSKILCMYLYGDRLQGLPALLSFEEVLSTLREKILQPAAKSMASYMISTIPLDLISLIEYQRSKNSCMPALALSQFLQNHFNQQSVIICLLKFMSSDSEASQTIDLIKLLEYVKK